MAMILLGWLVASFVLSLMLGPCIRIGAREPDMRNEIKAFRDTVQTSPVAWPTS
jgi:hypothetical protein